MEELGIIKNDWVKLKYGDIIMEFHVRNIYREEEKIIQENQKERDRKFTVTNTVVELVHEDEFNCEAI